MNDSFTSVFVLTTDFKPMRGGVAEYLHQLWNNVAHIRPVTVMSAAQTNGATWEHDYELQELSPLPQRRLGMRLADVVPVVRKINTLTFYAELRRYARMTVHEIRTRASNCEVYLGIWDMASHFWCRELHSAGIPYSFHLHGRDAIVPLYGRLPQWRNNDFLKAKALYANSLATAELVTKQLGHNVDIKIVHPGVGPKPPSSMTSTVKEQLKARVGVSAGPVLLTVARLIPRKGIDLVLGCIPELASRYSGLTYLVVGVGPEKDRLQQLSEKLGIGKHVHFLGNTEELEKWAFYELCDVFVMPNRRLDGTDWEGFGIVFMEAALSGKPAIGGNNGGVPEAVAHGETGILVDSEDAIGLVGALRCLLENADLRRAMGIRARERALTKFSWAATAESFVGHIAGSGSVRAKIGTSV